MSVKNDYVWTYCDVAVSKLTNIRKVVDSFSFYHFLQNLFGIHNIAMI